MVMQCPGYSREFDPTTLFRTLLVPVDFSPESRRALITACELRGRFGSDIHVFLMRTGGENSGFLGGLGAGWSRHELEQSAREHLRYFGESICEGMPCVTENVLFGEDVVEGTARAVHDCGATMIVLPVHDGPSLRRTRAERIVRAVDIPVLLCKGTTASPQETPDAGTRETRHVWEESS